MQNHVCFAKHPKWITFNSLFLVQFTNPVMDDRLFFPPAWRETSDTKDITDPLQQWRKY